MSITNIKDIAMKLWDDCNKHIQETDKKVNKEEYNMENTLYVVTVKREADNDRGIQIVGIFDTEDKANKVKEKVSKWMKEDGYDNYEIYINGIIINHVYGAPYGIQKYIF